MHQFFMLNILKSVLIDSQGVRISTFPILVLFRGYSSGANQIYATTQNGHCQRFIFEIIRYSKTGGHHVRSLVWHSQWEPIRFWYETPLRPPQRQRTTSDNGTG